MAARDRVRRWQASLRSFYLVDAPLLQFRVFAKPDMKSESFVRFEDDVRFGCARVLRETADDLEKQLATHQHQPSVPTSLTERIESYPASIKDEFSERERALLPLTRTLAGILDHLQNEVASEGLYDVPPEMEMLPGALHPEQP